MLPGVAAEVDLETNPQRRGREAPLPELRKKRLASRRRGRALSSYLGGAQGGRRRMEMGAMSLRRVPRGTKAAVVSSVSKGAR